MSDFEHSRRSFLGMSGAALIGGALNASGEDQKATTDLSAGHAGIKSRPNLILFVADELRADALSCYGNPICKTPNFDRIAKEGTKFANCHVQFPVCGASRCSLLTGWPTSVRGHRSLYYYLRPDEPNLFRYLKQAGYDVYWFGKNDALAAECFYESVTEWSEHGKGHNAPMTWPTGLTAFGLTPGSYSFLFPVMGKRNQTSDYALLQSTVEVLEREESNRPFCIFLALNQPHPPYTVPSDFYEMYSPTALPTLLPPSLSRRPSYQQAIREEYGLAKLDEATFRKIRAVYYGQVSYTDWLLGELLEALERTSRAKDTALFCLSDHGDYAGDYGLVEKWPSALEDCITHVPLLALVPGGAKGHEVKEMVELYDVMATCFGLAGVETHHTHFARSFVPQLNGAPGDPQRAAFAEGGYNVYEPQCFEPLGEGGGPYTPKIKLQNERPETVSRCAMIRTRDAKLVVRPGGQSELYDYRSDPSERENVFGEGGAATLQQELQGRLLHWYIQTTGVAPMDKDQRSSPPLYPDRQPPDAGWQRAILDL